MESINQSKPVIEGYFTAEEVPRICLNDDTKLRVKTVKEIEDLLQGLSNQELEQLKWKVVQARRQHNFRAYFPGISYFFDWINRGRAVVTTANIVQAVRTERNLLSISQLAGWIVDLMFPL